MINIQHDVPLSPLTTIGLGGKARLFVSCRTIDDLCEALRVARERNFRVHVLGGGSNVIFSDDGFNGIIIRVELKGISFTDEGDSVVVSAAAGEGWDDFVQQSVARDLAGIECLSGIPGLVGATPIQNVGAYGQEVCNSIVRVDTIDRRSLDVNRFSNGDCHFGYRQSIFKSAGADRYVVTEVTFRLQKHGQPTVQYPELEKVLAESSRWQVLPAGEQKLRGVREAVLALRRRKSMVLDPDDAHSRSVGSFFMNPILTEEQFDQVTSCWNTSGGLEQIPSYPNSRGKKIPAAWLVEKSGFSRGYRSGGVGVSQNHSLALVNYGGTTKGLLELADRIQRGVADRFGIVLEREPVFVRFE